MLRVTTGNGRVGHIVNSINDTDDGRVVGTLCGKTYDEYDVREAVDLDPCSACDNKLNGVVEDEPTIVLEDEKPAPKSETKKDK